MLIYFAGPTEHMTAALFASQYMLTRPALHIEDADAIIFIWDGSNPEVKTLMDGLRDGRPRYTYRIPYN